MENILKLIDVSTVFGGREGEVKAVSGVNLSVKPGEIVGLVGETGCGKSVLGRTILRLNPPGANTKGQILFDGDDILAMSKKELINVRGRKIAYINQNPSESLDPVMTVGDQIAESVRLYESCSKDAAREKAKDLLKSMSFDNPDEIMKRYPVELSGGQKQRVMVAMAMCGKPPFMIADEPTKGLDALVRGQVIGSLKKFIDYTNCAGIIITHDLKFAHAICNRIALMYAGEIVEVADADDAFNVPLHPYLRGLIGSMPQNGMKVIPGNSCSLIDLPEGCRFYDRCEDRFEKCKCSHPDMIELSKAHEVRCFKYDRS